MRGDKGVTSATQALEASHAEHNATLATKLERDTFIVDTWIVAAQQGAPSHNEGRAGKKTQYFCKYEKIEQTTGIKSGKTVLKNINPFTLQHVSNKCKIQK